MEKTLSKLFIGLIVAVLCALVLAAGWTAIGPDIQPETIAVVTGNFC